MPSILVRITVNMQDLGFYSLRRESQRVAKKKTSDVDIWDGVRKIPSLMSTLKKYINFLCSIADGRKAVKTNLIWSDGNTLKPSVYTTSLFSDEGENLSSICFFERILVEVDSDYVNCDFNAWIFYSQLPLLQMLFELFKYSVSICLCESKRCERLVRLAANIFMMLGIESFFM